MRIIPLGTLSVWIVNYNSSGFLKACLAGLSADTVRQIVILDNASSPADRLALESLAAADRRVSLLLSDVNLGFGAGHQRIAEFTAGSMEPGQLVWILNPDTVVTPAAVQRLCEIVGGAEAQIVSPVLLTGTRGAPVIWFAGGQVDVRRGRVTHLRAGQPAKVIPTTGLVTSQFVSGAAPMMSRAIWDRLGGFRDDLFLYWEDADLSLRAASLELKTAVALDAVIWHAEGGSSGTSTGSGPTAYYYTARNRIIVCSPFGSSAGLAFGRGFPFLFRLAATAFVKGRQRRFAKLWAVITGTIDGLRGRTGARQ